MKTTTRRYSGHDKHFGPFTYSGHNDGTWRPLGIVLDSGDGDESPGCHLRMHALGRTLICELPAIIKPWQREGAKWDTHSREYGATVSDGFLQVFLGPQTHDSTTTKSWCKHLPWTQWRYVRFSLFDAEGKHAWTETNRKRGSFEEQFAAQEAVSKVAFEFDDFDGQRIQATTHINEREYRFGEGWFKWLSLFRRARVHRSLDLKFSKEAGPEKGSWKGGTCGHGIEMLPGELHEAAFRRYCGQDQRGKYGKFRLTYVGRINQAKAT